MSYVTNAILVGYKYPFKVSFATFNDCKGT